MLFNIHKVIYCYLWTYSLDESCINTTHKKVIRINILRSWRVFAQDFRKIIFTIPFSANFNEHSHNKHTFFDENVSQENITLVITYYIGNKHIQGKQNNQEPDWKSQNTFATKNIIRLLQSVNFVICK